MPMIAPDIRHNRPAGAAVENLEFADFACRRVAVAVVVVVVVVVAVVVAVVVVVPMIVIVAVPMVVTVMPSVVKQANTVAHDDAPRGGT